MQAPEAGLELSEPERATGSRLLKLAIETDRIEGYTEPHAVVVARWAVKLGSRLGLHGRDLTALKFAALAHDIGEREMKARYLLRPSDLTIEERLDLGRHPIIGEQAAAAQHLPREVQLLIRWHHEWWNGNGYPDGLAGEAIPLGARILRVADTWSALNSDRPFRPRYDRDTATRILTEQAGIKCDPQIVKLLLDLLAEGRRIRETATWNPEPSPEPLEDKPTPSLLALWDELPPRDPEPTPEPPSPFAPAPFNPQLLNQVGAGFDDDFDSAPSREAISNSSRREAVASGRRWFGFELSVLRRLNFRSIAVPFAGRPELAWYLKFWGKQIATNDICQWSWWSARALVENRSVSLGPDEVARILRGAEWANGPLANRALRQWMNARDAAWFDNVWRNIQGLESIYQQALAYLHVFAVGDYVFSFTPETSYLRRPLSEVFTSLWRAQRPVMDNGQAQAAFNRDAHDFVRTVKADLLFVRLPRPGGMAMQRLTATGWRETWVRGNDADWERLIAGRDERLGDAVHSKEHYLELASDFFKEARQIPKWAITHTDDGVVSVAELSELVRRYRRRVKAYAKDFSDLFGGAKAYVIVAE